MGGPVLRHKQPPAGRGAGEDLVKHPLVLIQYFQSIEDFILLVGTSVAFVAFILWCCFPIEPKDSLGGSEHLSTQVKGIVNMNIRFHTIHWVNVSPEIDQQIFIFEGQFR